MLVLTGEASESLAAMARRISFAKRDFCRKTDEMNILIGDLISSDLLGPDWSGFGIKSTPV